MVDVKYENSGVCSSSWQAWIRLLLTFCGNVSTSLHTPLQLTALQPDLSIVMGSLGKRPAAYCSHLNLTRFVSELAAAQTALVSYLQPRSLGFLRPSHVY